MTNILELDSVILSYGSKRILQDIYLKIETGKISGLLGRNGSGKSCLLKILYGEALTENRSIRLNEYSLYEQKNIQKEIKYLPQSPFIPKHLTIKRIFEDFNIDFSELVSDFPNFEKFYKTRIMSLSGGERRIIEIYSILKTRSKFCLLDEPISHIMPVHIEKIKTLITREKFNKGIIVTDHMYNQFIDICDNIYILSNGKIYQTNSVKDLEYLGYIKEN
jgi:ABC-type multidrug transport system ATPase subunit